MVTERANEITDTKNLGNYESQVFTTEVRGETLICAGDIDLYVAGVFREAGDTYVRTQENPVIDLTGVPFLDSAGLASLLAIARIARASGKVIRVIATGNPRRVLRITGVDRMLGIGD